MEGKEITQGAPFDEASTQSQEQHQPVSENVNAEQAGTTNQDSKEKDTDLGLTKDAKSEEPVAELASAQENIQPAPLAEAIPETATAPEPVES